jgi:hypothetical protein
LACGSNGKRIHGLREEISWASLAWAIIGFWLLNMEALIQSVGSLCEICGGLSGTESTFAWNTLIFPTNHYFINAPYLSVTLTSPSLSQPQYVAEASSLTWHVVTLRVKKLILTELNNSCKYLLDYTLRTVVIAIL